MAEKDITEKIFESYNDVFADIVNGFIFDGEQRITPESLSEDLVHAQYKDQKGIIRESERDILKKWNNLGLELAVFGIENQSHGEKYMPLRVMGYDGAAYRNQLQKESGKISPEPVITIVLYFGTKKRWNYKRNLCSLFKIPSGLEKYVNDYNINVFEVAWLTEEEVNRRFRGDFRILAKFLVQKRLNKDYILKDPQEFRHADALLKLLSALTCDNRYESILSGGTVKNMCEVYDKIEKRGYDNGIKQGVAQGIEQGKQRGSLEMVVKLIAMNKLSIEDGAQVLNMTVSDLEKKISSM